MDDFRIDPPLVVKDTPRPRRLASLGEARAYVDAALRLAVRRRGARSMTACAQ